MVGRREPLADPHGQHDGPDNRLASLRVHNVASVRTLCPRQERVLPLGLGRRRGPDEQTPSVGPCWPTAPCSGAKLPYLTPETGDGSRIEIN